MTAETSSSPSPRQRFLAACRRERPEGPPPAWVMRQAGRYLPEYRQMREGKTFLETVHDPKMAAEITLQPLRRFDMDAAVVFSDILVPVAAMGLEVEFVGGVGPKISPPVRSEEDVNALTDFDPNEATGFLGETIRRVRAELGEDKAIIGFCGAPFTTASYMIEGGSSRSFENTKELLLREPIAFVKLVDRLVANLVPYLGMQIDAGADVVQIFDSWGGALDAATYRRVLLEPLQRLIAGARAKGAPVILYVNGGSHLLEVLADSGADVLGIDWRIDPGDAIRRVGNRVALQGNLDPCTLFGSVDLVREEVKRVLDAFANQQGYVFNLGSGILPTTPVESMETVFEAIRGWKQK